MIELSKRVLGEVTVLLIPVPFALKPNMGHGKAFCFVLSDVLALLRECS